MKATSDKYLRQIDLSWKDQPSTSYLIDYADVSDEVNVTDDALPPYGPNDRVWKALQSNTGYTRATYNNSSGLEPGTSRHYRVISLRMAFTARSISSVPRPRMPLSRRQ